MKKTQSTVKSLLEQISEVSLNGKAELKLVRPMSKPESKDVVIASSLGISPEEVRIFSFLLKGQINDDEPQGIGELGSQMGCSKIEALKWLPILLSLEKRRVIESEEYRKGLPTVNRPLHRKYWIAEHIMDKLIGNAYDESLEMTDEIFLLNYVFELGNLVRRWKLADDAFMKIVEHVLNENRRFPLIEKVAELNLEIREKTMLLTAIHHRISNNDLRLDLLSEAVYRGIRNRVMLRMQMINGQSRLVQDSYFEIKPDVFGIMHEVLLGSSSIKLFEHLEPVGKALFKESTETELISIVEPNDIKKVKLVYDGKVKEEYQRLQKLMNGKNLEGLFNRLEAKGLRKGVTVLLSGPPGTGKTEMVKQLARANGNRLMMVKMSEMKDAFVGQSEKNIRALFKQYEDEHKKDEKPPILLLNEADALIGKRHANMSGNVAVVNMLNTVQNILLQHLEDFTGILIATTNLPMAFDEAFNRRFLIHLNVDAPSIGARKVMWARHFPQLSTKELDELATSPLTGADIENLAIRMIHWEILENAQPTFETLRDLLSSGHLTKTANSVGFKLSA